MGKLPRKPPHLVSFYLCEFSNYVGIRDNNFAVKKCELNHDRRVQGKSAAIYQGRSVGVSRVGVPTPLLNENRVLFGPQLQRDSYHRYHVLLLTFSKFLGFNWCLARWRPIDIRVRAEQVPSQVPSYSSTRMAQYHPHRGVWEKCTPPACNLQDGNASSVLH